MAKIVGISGKRGSGKTLLGGILGYHGFKRVSLAGALKDDAMRLFNIGNEHVNGDLKEVPLEKLGGHTPRKMLIDFGLFCRRYSSDGAFFINRLFNTKIAQMREDDFVVIDDIRFINEAKFVKQHDGKLIRLERAPELNIYKSDMNDPSETELDDYDFDLVLSKEKNKTPADLEKFAYVIKDLFPKRNVNTTRTMFGH